MRKSRDRLTKTGTRMQKNKKALAGLLATGGIALSLFAANPAIAAGPTAQITGQIGEDLNEGGNYYGRYLRYVGDPAPAGYATEKYEWGSPFILTESPEDGAVTMTGTIEIDEMVSGQVGVIGLTDSDVLEAGERGDKADNGIYINRKSDDTYDVGLTDGDAGGGEWIQAFHNFPSDVGTLNVELTIDGTADPSTCASGPAVGADGCMTLAVNGGVTLTDSYGSVTDADFPDELSSGGNPGWYRYSEGTSTVGAYFDLTVSPVVVFAPQSADDCKNGGYENWDFKNQGLCVASVQANESAGK